MKDLWNNLQIRLAICLLIGVAFIIYYSPPYTPCTAQREAYNEGIKNLIGGFNRHYARCGKFPEPGGCYPMFEVLKKMEAKLRILGSQCRVELAKYKRTETWLTLGLEVYIKLAWGVRQPASYLYRNGWLEMSQLGDYCRLRAHYRSIFGEDAWLRFVERMMSDLPEVSRLNRTEIWNRSILSDPCKYSL